MCTLMLGQGVPLSHVTSIQIRAGPHQRRQIPRTQDPRGQGNLVHERPQARPPRQVLAPPPPRSRISATPRRLLDSVRAPFRRGSRIPPPIRFRDWQLDRWRAIETAFLNRIQARLCPPDNDPDPCSTFAAGLDISVNESRLLAFFLRRISKSSTERNRAFRALRQHRKSSPQSATPPQFAPPTVRPANFFAFAATSQNHFKGAESKPLTSPDATTSEPKSDPATPAAAEPRLACRAVAAGHIFDFSADPQFRPQSTDSKSVIELHPIPHEPNSNPASPPCFIVEPNVPSHPSRQPRCLQRPDRGPDRVLVSPRARRTAQPAAVPFRIGDCPQRPLTRPLADLSDCRPL